MSPNQNLKRGLLAFWGLWFLIVFFTNLFDALRAWGFLKPTWMAVSENYFLIQKVTSIYRLPYWVSDFFFCSVLTWEGICVVLFVVAAFYVGKEELQERNAIYRAFGFSLGLFATFILSCEIFIAPELEAVHIRIFTAQLATLLTVRLLPEPDAFR